MVKQELKKMLEKQNYGIVGNNSAVKICTWTKKSLRDEDFCYKQKFYGIRSHLCCQMTPALDYCPNSCLFCWRAVELTSGAMMEKAEDEPEEIIKGCIEGQRKLLSGFPGNAKANQKKVRESMEPMHFAISLAGEPTSYPKLDELIGLLHKKGKTTFLVTNGQFPEKIKSLKNLPTQLYISLIAPDEETYKKTAAPVFRDAWSRLSQSLKIMAELRGKTRTVIRMTLVKGLNMHSPEKYAELIKTANPLFVEAKAYMYVGYSRQRLKIENMPRHSEILEFSKEIARHSGYKIIDEKENSRVVLLMQKDFSGRIMKFPENHKNPLSANF
ncbi:MAG: 4-demethylwyosine synthase TYW1 [Candidatus Woesearchaeota archaeon]|nr:4-demethylwyosine synthase TYW1 [Candidatus Woesearchaeota archaeon]